MRRFAAGIAVATFVSDGERNGLTVGSLVSLSLEPPLVGISIGRDLALHELLRAAGAFGVSILRGDQADLAAHFARGVPPIALWSRAETRLGATGVTLLEGALAWLECRVAAEHPVGDHTFFVGEVVAVEEGEPGQALLYRDHSYFPAGPM
jgi:flavin reductase